jgi:superfamily II DNA helicase RecQ
MAIKVCNIRLDKEHLQLDQNRMNAFLDTVSVKLTSSNFVTTATTDYWSELVFYDDKRQDESRIPEVILTREDKEIYEALKTWRNIKAAELKLKQYMISHNSVLMNVAIQKPKTIAALKKIKGFGEVKTAKFGQDIIAILNG